MQARRVDGHSDGRRDDVAVIFDMDGVLTDTTELHYESWLPVAAELGIEFGRADYDAMRGLGRPESLAVLMRGWTGRLDQPEKQRLMDLKNREYLRLVDGMTSDNLLEGVGVLLDELRRRGVPMGLASSSRNAEAVTRRLGIRGLLDVLVDANDAERSKPDPQAFLMAAERLGIAAERCVVVEDASAGVAAGLAAGMRVVGVGPASRVGEAHLVVASLAELDADRLLGLVDA